MCTNYELLVTSLGVTNLWHNNKSPFFPPLKLLKKMKTIIRAKLLKLARIKYFSRWIILSADIVLSVSISLLTILFIEFATKRSVGSSIYALVGGLSALSSMVVFLLFQTYKGVIRHCTLQELWRLCAAVFAKVSLLFVVLQFVPTPLSFHVLVIGFTIDMLGTCAVLIISRIALINIYNMILNLTDKKKSVVLIYTSHESQISSSRQNNAYLGEYRVEGYLAFGPRSKNLTIAGLPVYFIQNQEDLEALCARNTVSNLLFTDIKEAREEQNRLIRYCEKMGIRTLITPPMEDLVDGKIRQAIRPVRIEDLLGRDEIRINMQEIAESLNGKTVLVTGAAGSIGSEICRQLAKFHIKQLVLFDNGETPMHNLRLELEEKYPTLPFHPIIGDVRSTSRVESIFACFQPDVVFHAAAYKHVPLMESNPCEAIRVNVRGTRNVADMALKYEAERFVMVSTDKAVNPTNVMGCSKRLAEIYVQSLSSALKSGALKGKTKYITTRFGNVLGSNGSVIPRFREQIEKGGPVTVTHPDIIRYFMTIPEACRLVLEAGTMGKGGEIFIFEMGEPVKIADLARRMIELAGFDPDTDIQIEYTGLRPGEKLYEELLSDKENTLPTPHEKIRVAKVREYQYSEVEPRIDALTETARNGKMMETVKIMKQIVPEFISQNSIFEKFDLQPGEEKKIKRLVI